MPATSKMRQRIGCDGGVLSFNPSTHDFVRTPADPESEAVDRPRARDVVVGPEVLFVQVTSQCNATCPYCYEAERPQRGSPLTGSELLQLVRDARKMEVVLVKFTGGEPLLSPHIYDLVSEVRSLGMGVWLYTNGTLLSTPVVRALRERGLSHLQINVDAGHDIETAGGLLRLKRRLSEVLDAELLPTLSYAVHDENLGGLSRIAEILDTFSGVSVCICPVFAPPCKCVGLAAAPDEQVLNEVRRFWERWHERWTQKTALAISQGDALGICGAGSNMVYVGVDGVASPCPVMTTDDCIAGDIRRTPLSTIWREAEIFRLLRGASVRDIPGCARCMFRHVCRGGCRMRAYAASGRILAEDPLSCRFYASLMDSDAPGDSIGWVR